MAKTVNICEVLYHDDKNPHGGPAGDGSFIHRFRGTKAGKAEAERFAAGKLYYGKPAIVHEVDVSRSMAQRHGLV